MKIYLKSIDVSYSAGPMEIELRGLVHGNIDNEEYDALCNIGPVELFPARKDSSVTVKSSKDSKYTVTDLINLELSKLRLKDDEKFKRIDKIFLYHDYFLDFIQEHNYKGRLSVLYNSTLQYGKYRVQKMRQIDSKIILEEVLF